VGDEVAGRPGLTSPGSCRTRAGPRGAESDRAGQQEKSTWTRADVVKYLGRVLPRSGMNPAAAAALLEDLADRALRSEFEPVICLEAPELVEAPRSLLRADGRSIYQRHGGVRYATRAQLVMEERMLTQARADGAPRLTCAQAVHALGAQPGVTRRFSRVHPAMATATEEEQERNSRAPADTGGIPVVTR